MKKSALLCLLIPAFANIFGQSAVNLREKPCVIKAGMSYLNNYVYNGRSDSLKTPYFIPSLTVVYDSAFTINSNLYYLSQGEDKGLDFLELNASYEFEITKKLSSGIYGTKYFYKGSSNAITGNINATIGANFGFDFNVFELNMGTYFLFTNGHTDVNFNPGIEREIIFGSSQAWKLRPSFYINFSTLNFYDGFSTQRASRKLIKNKTVNPNLASIEEITTVVDKGMKLLDYELSLPLTYENKKWGISLESIIAFPQNPIHTNTQIIKLQNGRSQVISNKDSISFSERNLTTIFYAQLNLFLKF